MSRDFLIHLSFSDGLAAIENFKKTGARYLLLSTYITISSQIDIETGIGGRSVNPELPPFNFPKPLLLINEKCSMKGGYGKCLGLWEVKQLR
jgi:hypothetical protein